MTGELPSAWAQVPLGKLGTWTGGGTPSKAVSRYWTDGTVPWVSPKDMKVAVLHKTEDYITEDAVRESSTRLVAPNSVLIVTRSGILERILPVAINAIPVALNQDLKAISPSAAVDARYLYWLLVGRGDEILRSCTKAGTTVASVETSRLMELVVPLAPLAEQRRIVACLEEHLSALDAAVEGLARARANLARFRASAIINGVLGGTAAAAAPDLEHELPDGWQWRTMADCCSKIDSGSTPPADRMFAGSGEIPFIKVYNLTMTGRLDFTVRPTFVERATHDGRLRRSRLLPGDVLTNIVGPPLGKVAVVPDTHPEWNTNQAVVCFRTGPDLINRYLALMLQAEPVIARLSSQARATAGQYNVSLTMCRTLRVPVPPIGEQQRIVVETDRQLEAFARLTADINVQFARSSRLRQSILHRAFAGLLVPHDPDEDPASIHSDEARAGADESVRPATRRRPVRCTT